MNGMGCELRNVQRWSSGSEHDAGCAFEEERPRDVGTFHPCVLHDATRRVNDPVHDPDIIDVNGNEHGCCENRETTGVNAAGGHRFAWGPPQLDGCDCSRWDQCAEPKGGAQDAADTLRANSYSAASNRSGDECHILGAHSIAHDCDECIEPALRTSAGWPHLLKLIPSRATTQRDDSATCVIPLSASNNER